MSKINNYKRRQFLKVSALGATFAMFPDFLLANTGEIRTEASANFNPDVEIEFTSRDAQVNILDAEPKTKVQKYYATLLKGPKETLHQLQGNYLGPILNLVKGQKVRIFYKNELSEASIIHWHGLHVPQQSDGHPMYTMAPGQQFVYEFEVKNNAGTSLYHSHAHEKTGEQVYNGLSGLIIVTDDAEKALGLPTGEFDLPFVIQDRTFNNQNQLQYLRMMMQGMMGFLGDTIVVNGKANSEFSVKSRAYRLRTVNGSSSRIYKLGWEDGTALTAIGTDAHLLEKPETRPYIMLAPGERVDLWLDFSGRPVGTKLVLYSLPYTGAMPAMYEKMHGGKSGEHGGMGMMGDMKMGDVAKSEHGGMKMGDTAKSEHGGMGMMGGMKMGDAAKGEHGGMGGMDMMKHLPQGAKFAIATFKVTEKATDSPKLPEKLVAFKRMTLDDVDNAGNPLPIAISEKPMAPQFNGKSFSMDQVMDFEKVKLGSIKLIRIFHDHSGQKMAHGDKKDTAMASEHGAMSTTEKPKDANAQHDGMKMDNATQGEHGGMGMGMMGGMKMGGDSKGEHGGMGMMGGMHGGGMKMGDDAKGEHGGMGMGMMGGGMGGMNMTMAHPVHLHGQQFQVLSRKVGAMGSAGYETVKDGFIDSGYKDTILVMPGEEVEIIKPFQDYKGLFLYHCHNLDHEGMGMMRQFFIS